MQVNKWMDFAPIRSGTSKSRTFEIIRKDPENLGGWLNHFRAVDPVQTGLVFRSRHDEIHFRQNETNRY